MKKHICETWCLLDNQHITEEHLRWQCLKYEIRKFPPKYAKAIAENTRKEIDSLEIELKHLETDLKNYQTSQKYLDCKSKLEQIYSKKANEVRIRRTSYNTSYKIRRWNNRIWTIKVFKINEKW